MPVISQIPISQQQEQTYTVSQFIESQFPAFVREDYPQFVAFVKAYYEWMEKNGADVYEAKITNSSPNTITFPNTASTVINAYQNMNVVCLNGPTKGHTRAITAYDPTTFTATVYPAWTAGYVPLPNTNMVIRDSMAPDKLLEYRDIDETLDEFITYFRDEFLYQIPGDILADKRRLLKHVKQFYQARGSESSFRFLFRLLYNEEIEVYYPKVDLFRLDDARWVIQYVMRTSTTENTFDWTSRQIIGLSSGATASVEAVYQKWIDGVQVTDLYLSNFQGTFGDPQNDGGPEAVKIVYPFNPPAQTDLGSVTDLLEPATIVKSEQAYLILSGLTIQDPGMDYEVGDAISITGGGALAPASGYVSAVFQTFYNGSCQTPPTTFYLQPFFGPNDGNDAEDIDPTQDGVCIPGLYFFDDVQSDISEGDLLTTNEILLASTSPDIDNFFAGDQISIVGGTGTGQQGTIIAYNGTTNVATVNFTFNPVPDGTTQYSILHNRGGIKAVAITDFGVGFTSTPTVSITSAEGTEGVLIPNLGLVGTSQGQWIVGRNGGIGGVPTTTDSMTDSNKVFQDSYYWQDFSYDIHSGESLNQYADVVKTLLHPAGMKMFGTVWIKSNPKTTRMTLKDVIYFIEIDCQFYNMDLTVSSSYTLNIQPEAIQTGSTNSNLDQWKFVAFPPNPSFNLYYAFPNQNYWSPNGPGNTQISNFADIPIGTIINNPTRRTKFCPDSYINITSTNLITYVSTVGQNYGVLENSKFTGYPPYPGFDTVYPPPNQLYWTGMTSPGNTQLKDFQDVVISNVIDNPRSNRNNFCVDSDIEIYTYSDNIPVIGNVVEYAFLEGMRPQIVYNVSPNSFDDLMNGVFGTNESTESIDPVFDQYGIILNSADSQFVTATAIPVFLQQATVVIVAQAANLSVGQTLANCIQSGGDNGYSIDITTGGGLLFRVQYEGTTISVSYPAATIVTNDWFMATLRFDNGLLTGQFNMDAPLQAQFSSYPADPIADSPGWYLGNGSVSYTTMAQNASLFKESLFGTNRFLQPSSGSVTANFGYFDGRYAFAIFYDRALYNFEVSSIYSKLQTELLSQRGIALP